MQAAQETDPALEAIGKQWLFQLTSKIADTSASALCELFTPDGIWRDILAMTWDIRTFTGRSQIEIAWIDAFTSRRASGFVVTDILDCERVEQFDRSFILVRFDFRTAVGLGSGIARLVENSTSSNAQAWTLLTTLQRVDALPELNGPGRPSGTRYSRGFGTANWLDDRVAASRYRDQSPQVLVVGAGQAGLSIAARLVQLGVNTLVVDRNERIGDNWRKRYHSLTLHNVVWTNHLPYLPFPPSFPVYIPKDKLANWFEFYADAMELNVWSGTELVGARRDASGCWSATLRQLDGTTIELSPRHLVIAIGVSGIPNLPTIDGLDDFAGEVMHSSGYRDGANYDDKRVLVVGTGNSGHDIAQDLCASGAHVTLLQRSPTTIVSLEPSSVMYYSLYREDSSVEEADLLTLSLAYPLMKMSAQLLTERACAHDAELLDALHAVGFRTDVGEDGTGWPLKYLRHGGGYYFNVGCSELIAQRRIAVRQYGDLRRITPTGAEFYDDAPVDLDAIVLATGYTDMSSWIADRLGPDVAERIGAVWGIDDQGEMRNVWKRTRQEGLWFIMGSLAHARIFSRFLALQIAEDERDRGKPVSTEA